MNKRKTPKTARKTFLKHSTGEILSFDSALAAARYLDVSDRSLTKSFLKSKEVSGWRVKIIMTEEDQDRLRNTYFNRSKSDD